MGKSEKLCATLEKKTNYVCHYKLLDLYSKIGVKVENIRRALKFREKNFLEPWVDLHTRGRQDASKEGNEVKKAFHKLCVNR